MSCQDIIDLHADGHTPAVTAFDRGPSGMGNAQPCRICQLEFHKPFPLQEDGQIQAGGVEFNGFFPFITI